MQSRVTPLLKFSMSALKIPTRVVDSVFTAQKQACRAKAVHFYTVIEIDLILQVLTFLQIKILVCKGSNFVQLYCFPSRHLFYE
jgi:hypothetical protein